KRIGFIRKLGEQTARQRQIIDLIDNEAGLTEQERKLLHVLATPEQRLELVQDFVRQEAGERHAWSFAIHNPKASIDGGEQPHA
ncbi:hypothetical protein ACSLNR_27760, partial [Escherichia coli]